MLKRIAFIAATAAFVTGSGRLSAQELKLAEEKPGLISRAKVSFDAARATAQAKVPKGKLVTAEVEEEDGKLIYTLVYKTDGKKGVDEVNVDALTGKIVAVEHENTEPGAANKEEKEDKKAEKKEDKKEVKKDAKKGGGGEPAAAPQR